MELTAKSIKTLELVKYGVTNLLQGSDSCTIHSVIMLMCQVAREQATDLMQWEKDSLVALFPNELPLSDESIRTKQQPIN